MNEAVRFHVKLEALLLNHSKKIMNHMSKFRSARVIFNIPWFHRIICESEEEINYWFQKIVIILIFKIFFHDKFEWNERITANHISTLFQNREEWNIQAEGNRINIVVPLFVFFFFIPSNERVPLADTMTRQVNCFAILTSEIEVE